TLAGICRIGARTVHRRHRQTPHPAPIHPLARAGNPPAGESTKAREIDRLSAIVFAVRDLVLGCFRSLRVNFRIQIFYFVSLAPLWGCFSYPFKIPSISFSCSAVKCQSAALTLLVTC